MTRIVTVSFRTEDEPLWEFIEKTAGQPVTGIKIRDMLHAIKDASEATKEAEGE